MENLDISVILPFFNAEKYIDAALSSILKSSHENIELIAVNDGSSDSSAEICKSFAERDSRVRLIRKENGGVSSARNAGLAVAKGEFIAFADADDEVLPEMYEYLLKKAVEYEADIVQCAVIFEDGARSEVLFSPGRDVVYEKDRDTRLLGKYLSYSCWSKIYRRRSLGDIRFNESLAVGEDLYYNLEALSRCERMIFTPKPLYRYVQRRTSVMNTLIESRRLEEFSKMLEMAEESFAPFPALHKFIKLAKIKNAAHVLSLSAGENSEYCKLLFAKTRKSAKKSVISVLLCRGISIRKKVAILLAVIMPKVYRRLILRKRKNEKS